MNRRNKILVISGIIWAFIALLATVLGYFLAGADIAAWFSSKWAMYIYVFLIVYLVVIIVAFIIPTIKDRL